MPDNLTAKQKGYAQDRASGLTQSAAYRNNYDIYSHVVPGLQEAAALRFEEGLVDARQPEPTPQPV